MLTVKQQTAMQQKYTLSNTNICHERKFIPLGFKETAYSNRVASMEGKGVEFEDCDN